MPFGAHETMEAHEALNEKINLINHFTLYAGMCEDAELRELIERQLRPLFEAYDRLLAYTHDYRAASGRPPVYTPLPTRPGEIRYGLDNPDRMGPQFQGKFTDAQIASAMLCAHKHSAKVHLAGSLECADPHVREMLLNSAVLCTQQAYETFLYMNRRGMYQVPTLNDHTAKTYLHAYQPMNEMVSYRM